MPRKQFKRAFDKWVAGDPDIVVRDNVTGEVFEKSDTEIFRQGKYPYMNYYWFSSEGNAISFYDPKNPILLQQDPNNNGRYRYAIQAYKTVDGRKKTHTIKPFTYQVTANMFSDMIDTFTGDSGEYEIHHILGYKYYQNDRESRKYNAGVDYLLKVDKEIHQKLLTYVGDMIPDDDPNWTVANITPEQHTSIQKRLVELTHTDKYAVVLTMAEVHEGQIKKYVNVEYIKAGLYSEAALKTLYASVYQLVLDNYLSGLDDFTLPVILPDRKRYIYQYDRNKGTMEDVTIVYKSDKGREIFEEYISNTNIKMNLNTIKQTVIEAGYDYLFRNVKKVEEDKYLVSFTQQPSE